MPGWSGVFSLDRDKLLEEADDATREELQDFDQSFDEKTEPPEPTTLPPPPAAPQPKVSRATPPPATVEEVDPDENSQTMLDADRGLQFQDGTVPSPIVVVAPPPPPPKTGPPTRSGPAAALPLKKSLPAQPRGDGESTELDLSDDAVQGRLTLKPKVQTLDLPQVVDPAAARLKPSVSPKPTPIAPESTAGRARIGLPEPTRSKALPAPDSTQARAKLSLPAEKPRPSIPSEGSRPAAKPSIPNEGSSGRLRPSIPNENTGTRAKLSIPAENTGARLRPSDPPRARAGLEPLPLRRRDEVHVGAASESSEGLGPQVVRRPPADPDLLENAPVVRTSPIDPNASVELTQINAAAALGIAPEPSGPAGKDPSAPPEVPASPALQLPVPAERLDFGELKLAEKEEVLARYPVEAPGAALAEKINEQVPVVATLSKIIPLAISAFVAIGFITFFLVGPIRQLTKDNGTRHHVRELPAPPTNSPTIPALDAPPGGFRPAGQRELPPGAIRLTSSPSRATVEVDGFYVGRTPLMLASPEGDHAYEVKLRVDGHKPWQGRILRGPDLQHLDIEQVVEGAAAKIAELELDASGRFDFNLSLEAE